MYRVTFGKEYKVDKTNNKEKIPACSIDTNLDPNETMARINKRREAEYESKKTKEDES